MKYTQMIVSKGSLHISWQCLEKLSSLTVAHNGRFSWAAMQETGHNFHSLGVNPLDRYLVYILTRARSNIAGPIPDELDKRLKVFSVNCYIDIWPL